MAYSVSVQRAVSRPIAAVRASLPIRDVPSRFGEFLDQVYAAAKTGAVALDGQNVFVYRAGSAGIADVEFGVGLRGPFKPTGNVVESETPAGDVATTTHWGSYAGLGAAHDAVVTWCKAERRTLAGVSWEVYGHWSDDPTQVRTDIYHLLSAAD